MLFAWVNAPPVCSAIPAAEYRCSGWEIVIRVEKAAVGDARDHTQVAAHGCTAIHTWQLAVVGKYTNDL